MPTRLHTCIQSTKISEYTLKFKINLHNKSKLMIAGHDLISINHIQSHCIVFHVNFNHVVISSKKQ